MSLNYASASSLNNSRDRLSDLVSYTVGPPPVRTAKTIVNNNNSVTSVNVAGAPVTGNSLEFLGSGYRLGIQNTNGSWSASSVNSTDGGANGKLSFSNQGQFTIECFIYWNGTGGLGQQGWWEAGGGGIAVGYDASFLYAAISGSSYNATFSTALSRQIWYHIAMTRSGSNQLIQCFVNGTQIGSGFVQSANWTGQDPFGGVISPYIGGFNSGGAGTFNGYIQEFRISNIRRYSANFTPTTVPFVNDANTVLLIHGSNPNVDDNS